MPAADVNAVCAGTHSDYTEITAGRMADDAPSGIEVTVSSDADADLIGGSGDGAPDEYYFFACVRAEPGADGTPNDSANVHGRWAISGRSQFSRKLGTPGNVRVNKDDTEVTVSWNRVAGAASYEVKWSDQTDVAFIDAGAVTCAQESETTTCIDNSVLGSGAGTRYYWVVAKAAVGGSDLTSAPSGRKSISN